MSTEFDPEAEAADLVDHAAIARAEAALRDAEERRDGMVKLAMEAERRAIEARQQWPMLIEAAAAGAVPSMDEAVAIYLEGENADRYAGFLGTVARRMEGPVEAAREALADVRHAAWWPVFRKGQDMRIAAAGKRDRAKQTGPRGERPQDVAERDRLRALVLGDAPQTWASGKALCDLAMKRGVRFSPQTKFVPSWPDTSERAERAFFGRSWVEELTDAAE